MVYLFAWGGGCGAPGLGRGVPTRWGSSGCGVPPASGFGRSAIPARSSSSYRMRYRCEGNRLRKAKDKKGFTDVTKINRVNA